MTGFRVTYATLTADDGELDASYRSAVSAVRSGLGAHHALLIGDHERSGDTFTTVSPIDTSVEIGHFTLADGDTIDEVVTVAAAAQRSWATTPWQQRCDLLDRAAHLISQRSVADGAALAWENGKSQLEAIGEVEEAADLIRYYTHAMREHQGFSTPMERFSDAEVTSDVMRPYGVWAVIAPFNYPSALVAGPAGAALVAGNSVVIKPSPIGSLSGHLIYRALVDAGVPRGVVNIVTGGADVGSALVHHPGVAGVTFTGSSVVGMSIIAAFTTSHPKPAICEMGGKNPVIVTASADLDLAVEGTARSAFGFGGQKCSAASRVYVDRQIAEEFTARLVARAEAVPTTSPLEPGGFLSPVVDQHALERFDAAVADARLTGEVLVGGHRLTGGHFDRGNFVAPTVVRVPDDSTIWTTELFVPLIVVRSVASLDEAIRLANALPFGLTAGLFATDPGEIDTFLECIEAGVVYVNRAAGATTGAWPGVQPFGGWKRSGTAGKAGGGPYYLQQYLREQSRTIVSTH
ncbi:MAG: aldehyde dehydrogenase family protein [Ilumatobacteraceae bacterium]